MGAFASVLTAMTVRESLIPTRCCTCPEMPRAMYSFGLTRFPESPMCLSSLSHLRSPEIGLLHPTSPPRRRASSSAIARSSFFLNPLPTATITSAFSSSTLDASGLTISTNSSFGASTFGEYFTTEGFFEKTPPSSKVFKLTTHGLVFSITVERNPPPSTSLET
jgi:hypothetical protein